MSSDLETINLFLISIRMEMNVEKTKYIVFKNPTNKVRSFTLNGTNIERVENYKYLGLVIDSYLNWDEHIEMIKNKILPYMFILRRSRDVISAKTARLIYFAFIYPHLKYMNPLWISAAES